jgi:glucosamine kinase
VTLWALIDGGGSKTRVRIVDAVTGEQQVEKLVGPGNLSLGATAVWQSIQAAFKDLGALQPTRIFAGLAGVETASARDAFLHQATIPTVLMSDRDSGLLGALGGAPGACLTVGTGVALSWCTPEGVVSRRGGLGFVLGDAGGGAWLGHQALQRLAYHVDRDSIDQSMTAVLAMLPMGSTLTDWIQFAQTAKPADFATLAPLIFHAAKDGVPLAMDIVNAGVLELLDLIQAIPSGLPVALVGGLAGCYQDRFLEAGVPIIDARGDALDGLWLYASGAVDLELQTWVSHGAD